MPLTLLRTTSHITHDSLHHKTLGDAERYTLVRWHHLLGGLPLWSSDLQWLMPSSTSYFQSQENIDAHIHIKFKLFGVLPIITCKRIMFHNFTEIRQHTYWFINTPIKQEKLSINQCVTYQKHKAMFEDIETLRYQLNDITIRNYL